MAAAEDSAHLKLRRGHGEATKENHIVYPNGGQALMEFCPYSGKARPSSDQSFILSKGSFILSQGYVVKNISNDDSNTQWVKMLEQSFISREISYRDLFFDPLGQCCLLEPEDSRSDITDGPGPVKVYAVLVANQSHVYTV